MSEHTKEPWRISDRSTTVQGGVYIDGNEQFEFNGNRVPQCVALTCKNYGENTSSVRKGREEANARRIVACVNALAGIDDPEAWVAKAKEAINGGR